MKISVCIPTYNSASTIPKTIESALAQTYSDFEILVSDNASTDATRGVVSRYRDPRIRYHRHDANLGYAANVRSCLERGAGEFAVILCADDYWCGEFLARTVEATRRSDRVTVAYSAYHVLREHPRGGVWSYDPCVVPRPECCRGIEYARQEFLAPYTILSGNLFRRRIAVEQGSFTQTRLRFLPDLLHRVRVAAQGDVAYVREPLAVYREHGGSITSRHRPQEWIVEERRVRMQMVQDEGLRKARLDELLTPSMKTVCLAFLQKYPYLRAFGASSLGLTDLLLGLWRLSPGAMLHLRILARALGTIPLPRRFLLSRHDRRRRAELSAGLAHDPEP